MKEDSIRENYIKKVLDNISKVENMVDRPMYNLQQEQKVEIQIKVDNNVEHGKFLPDKKHPGRWLASEQTYRAMKKDLFSFGHSIDEIQKPYECHSCRTQLDQQFWNFCPYCGHRFLEHL